MKENDIRYDSFLDLSIHDVDTAEEKCLQEHHAWKQKREDPRSVIIRFWSKDLGREAALKVGLHGNRVTDTTSGARIIKISKRRLMLAQLAEAF